MSEENKAIIRRFVEECSDKGNLDLLDVLVATNQVESFKQLIINMRTAFPDVQMTIEDEIAEGDKVVTRWTPRGTHQGEFGGTPPTGKQITWSGVTIFRIAGGKIVERWIHGDSLGLRRQIGAISAR